MSDILSGLDWPVRVNKGASSGSPLGIRRATTSSFINQGPGENGVPQFEERAAAYKLDQRRFGTQSTFFNYDGDLDVYLLNTSVHAEQTYGRSSLREAESERAGNRLLRNDLGSES